MTQYETEPSGWAAGGAIFAGVLMLVVGVFQGIAGITAIANDDFYVVTENYVFDLDASAWGWIHLILGVLVAIAGWSLIAGKVWGGLVAIALATPERDRKLLHDPVLPVLVDRHHRHLHVGDLGRHTARRLSHSVTRRTP